MHGLSKYGSIGLGLATMVTSFVVTLQMSTPVAPVAADPFGVDRVLKGDRLPLIEPTHLPPAQRAGPTRESPQLPEGCVTRFDPQKNRFSPEVAGRCVV